MNEDKKVKEEIEKNLEKAKVVSEAVKDLPIGPLEKEIAIAITALGGNPVPFLVGTLSYYETLRAERENPAPELPEDYTPLERLVHEMLVENTGAHILDYGAVYGRHWEINRKIKDFRKTPTVEVTVWKDGWIDVEINVFHFLTWAFDRDEICEKLEKEFYEFAESRDGSWFKLMREFAKEVLREKYGYEVLEHWNTYNFECNLLSQVLQGITFKVKGDDYYVMLQVHNGCDVRGGYTKPRFLKLAVDEYDFYDAMCYVRASCGCTTAIIDRGELQLQIGADDPEREVEKHNDLPAYWRTVPMHENAESWEYKLVCERCKREVEFYSYMDDCY
ncbi:MAG: hypothetical protein QXT64_08590 [Desulfurococcaceae archaeon]